VGIFLLVFFLGVILILLAVIGFTPSGTLEVWDQRWDFGLAKNPAEFEAIQRGRFVIFPLLLAWFALLAGAIMLWKRRRVSRALGIISLAIVVVGASIGSFILTHRGRMQSAKPFMAAVQQEVPRDTTMFMVNGPYYPPGYYAAGPCQISGSSEEMINSPGSYALSSEKHYLRMTPEFRKTFEIVRKSHPYAADGRRPLWLLRHRNQAKEQ